MGGKYFANEDFEAGTMIYLALFDTFSWRSVSPEEHQNAEKCCLQHLTHLYDENFIVSQPIHDAIIKNRDVG